ncbi:MAG: lipoate--protein ligase family protein [Bacteroidales bacterium]|nr:lipoate--protein ligase family protein [Bacteroidales bacterium]
MRFLRNTSTDPHFNMSLDEWCFRHLPPGGLFFFVWRNSPSVIIGENQNAEQEVNLEYLQSKGIALARRITGGGAVYHDLQNLNYTIVGRGASPEPIVAALRSFGVDAVLSGRNDIFVDGLKVSGYARRFEGSSEMIHGTLMYDVDIDTLTKVLDTPQSKLHLKGVSSVRSRVGNLKSLLPFASIGEFASALEAFLSEYGEGRGEYVLSPGDLREIERVADEKYRREEWIYGRQLPVR